MQWIYLLPNERAIENYHIFLKKKKKMKLPYQKKNYHIFLKNNETTILKEKGRLPTAYVFYDDWQVLLILFNSCTIILVHNQKLIIMIAFIQHSAFMYHIKILVLKTFQVMHNQSTKNKYLVVLNELIILTKSIYKMRVVAY